MIRALANFRILVTMLVLSMVIAVSVAPAVAFANSLCDRIVSPPSQGAADNIITTHVPHDADQQHRAQAGDCCTPSVTHCSAGVLPAAADVTDLQTVAALKWQPVHLDGVAGLAPFEDFRPPRRIG
jgi:hypothetical protein